MTARRCCFYVDETMRTDRGFVPSVVTEDEPGYAPLVGNGAHAAPWFWGDDLHTARRLCTEANTARGLTADAVTKIVASSFAAANGRRR